VDDRTELDLFRSRGTKHDGVFSADEHFVLYAHAEAMKVLGELRIGRYVYAFNLINRWQCQNASDANHTNNMAQQRGKLGKSIRTGLDSDDHPLL